MVVLLTLKCNFSTESRKKWRPEFSSANNAPYSGCMLKETSVAWGVSTPSPAVKVSARQGLQTEKTGFGFNVLTTMAALHTSLCCQRSPAPFSTREPCAFILLLGSQYGNAFLHQRGGIHL